MLWPLSVVLVANTNNIFDCTVLAIPALAGLLVFFCHRARVHSAVNVYSASTTSEKIPFNAT